MAKRKKGLLAYAEITLDDWVAQSSLDFDDESPPTEVVTPPPALPPQKAQMVLPNGDVATPQRCKKECIKLLERLGQTHGRWEVFSSFIEMLAIAISNQVDFAHYSEREKIYHESTARYKKEEIEVLSQIASMLKMTIELSKDAPCDILGPIFHEMELHDEWKGQFFTPQSVCDMMAMLTVGNDAVDKEKGYFTVCEPCCGSGAMILAVAKVIQQQGLTPTCVVVSATDIDIRCVYMCYIQLSLYGIPAIVTHGNSLTMEQWSC